MAQLLSEEDFADSTTDPNAMLLSESDFADSSDVLRKRLRLKDSLLNKLGYVKNRVKDDAPDADGWTLDDYRDKIQSSEFNTMDEETVSKFAKDIDAKHADVSKKRGFGRIIMDAGARGFQRAVDMDRASNFVGKKVDQESRDARQALVDVEDETDIAHPRSVGSIKNIRGVGDAVTMAAESMAENLPNMLMPIASSIAGAKAGGAIGATAGPAGALSGATIGAMTGGFLGSLRMNVGEAVMDQTREGLKLNRGLALGQGVGYSLLDMGGAEVAAARRIARGTLSVPLREAKKEFVATIAKAAKTIGKDMFREGWTEAAQSGVVGNTRRKIQTGSFVEPGKSPVDLVWNALDEAYGGAFAGGGMSMVTTGYQYAGNKNMVKHADAEISRMAQDTDIAKLDPYDRVILARIRVNMAVRADVESSLSDIEGTRNQMVSDFLASKQAHKMTESERLDHIEKNLSPDAIRENLTKTVENIDKYDVEARDTLGGTAKTVLNAYESEFSNMSIDDVPVDYKSDFDSSEITGMRDSKIVEPDGSETYKGPKTDIMIEGRPGAYSIRNNNGMKMPIGESGVVDTLEEAVAFASKLARFNQYRIDNNASKAAFIKGVAEKSHPGANVVQVDSPKQIKDPDARARMVVGEQAFYNPKDNTVYVMLDSIQNPAQAEIMLQHEDTHRALMDMMTKEGLIQPGESVDSAKRRFFGSNTSRGAESSEESVAKANERGGADRNGLEKFRDIAQRWISKKTGIKSIMGNAELRLLLDKLNAISKQGTGGTVSYNPEGASDANKLRYQDSFYGQGTLEEQAQRQNDAAPDEKVSQERVINRDTRRAGLVAGMNQPVEPSVAVEKPSSQQETDRPTRHRVFEGGSPITVSNPNALRATDTTKAYRLTNQSQVDDMLDTGGVRAREGKMKGGHTGEVHWSAGHDTLGYNPSDGKYVIETDSSNLNEREGMLPNSAVRLWKVESGKWVDVTNTLAPKRESTPASTVRSFVKTELRTDRIKEKHADLFQQALDVTDNDEQAAAGLVSEWLAGQNIADKSVPDSVRVASKLEQKADLTAKDADTLEQNAIFGKDLFLFGYRKDKQTGSWKFQEPVQQPAQETIQSTPAQPVTSEPVVAEKPAETPAKAEKAPEREQGAVKAAEERKVKRPETMSKDEFDQFEKSVGARLQEKRTAKWSFPSSVLDSIFDRLDKKDDSATILDTPANGGKLYFELSSTGGKKPKYSATERGGYSTGFYRGEQGVWKKTREEVASFINGRMKRYASSGVYELGGEWGQEGFVRRALEANRPVNAIFVDELNKEYEGTAAGQIILPPGYVREGDLYVFKPEPPTPPDGGGKKPSHPAREPETQALQTGKPSSDVSGREGASYESMTPEELDAEVERMEDAQPVQPQGVYSRRATMSPEEAGRVAALADLALWKRGDTKTEWGKEINGGMAADTLRKLKDGSVRMKGHRNLIQAAVEKGGKVNASAVDAYKIQLPEGYVREGDLYVFKPEPPPDDGGKKPVPAPVSETPAPPKGAKVSTAYGGSGVSYRGEFVKDNGDGTATLRAFGEKPKTGLFRRYGTDAKGVQITKDVTVPLASVKETEPAGDTAKLTPAQRAAVRRAAKAQETATEAEISAGESAGADTAGRMASAKERKERRKTDNGDVMFRRSIADNGYFDASNALVTEPGEVRFRRAFHGSPHLFDKFDIGKIGTGEGAQAYGWGLYFAQARGVAETYSTTGEPAQRYKALVRELANSQGRSNTVIVDGQVYSDYQAAQRIQDADRAFIASLPETIQVKIETAAKGVLYTVDIDATDDELLDLDKPLSEQSEKVRAALGPLLEAWVGNDYDTSRIGGQQIYNRAAIIDGGSENASSYLNSIGIKGLRYLDHASRGGEYKVSRIWENEGKPDRPQWRVSSTRGTGDSFMTEEEAKAEARRLTKATQTSNYVIFDDKLIKITKRNDQEAKGYDEDGGVRFRRSTVTPEQDSAYMKAVERGDMETAQRMADEAAKRAGYNVGPVWHSSSEVFNVFRKRYERDGVSSAREASIIGRFGKGIFFSSDPVVSGKFGGVKRKFYLKIDEPTEYDLGGASYYDGTLHDQETGEVLLDDDGEPMKVDKDMLPDEMAEIQLDDSGTRNTGVIVRGVYESIPSKGKPKPMADTYVVGNPSQIKSADPVTRDDQGNVIPLSKRFNEETPDIRFRRSMSGTPSGADILDTETGLQAARRIVQDYMQPWERKQEALQKTLKRKLSDDVDVYRAEDRSYGLIRNGVHQFEKNFIDKAEKVLNENGLTVDEFDQFLMAKAGPDRNKMIAERTEGKNLTGSGQSDVYWNNILAAYRKQGKYDKLNEAAEHVWALNRAVLDMKVEAGLMSKAQADVWKTKSPFYVPLRSDDAEADYKELGKRASFSLKRKESKSATGRAEGNEADTPFAFSVMQSLEAVGRANKNVVYETAAKLIEQNPSDLWHIEKRIPTKQAYDSESGKVISVPDAQFEDAPNVVIVKRDGKKQYIVFEGADGLKLARSLKKDSLQKAPVIVSALTRTYAMMRTAMVPTFILRNLRADFLQLTINMTAENKARMVPEVFKSMKDSWQAVWSYERDGKASGALAGYANEFFSNGGQIAGVGVQTVDKINQTLNKHVKKHGSVMQKVMKAEHFYEYIERGNATIETGTRLALYATLRKQGYSISDSIEAGKNITVNFNRKGELGPLVNSLYMFSNVAVQDAARSVKALSGKNGKAVVLGLLGAGFLAAMLNNGDDDKEDKTGAGNYKNIPESDKQRNIIIKVGGKYIKQPIRGIWAWVYYAGTKAGDVAFGKYDSAKAAKNVAGAALDTINFLGTSGSVAQFVTPTILDPVVQHLENKDWKGDPMRQRKFTDAQPDSATGMKRTPDWIKATAKGLNKVTGGDDATKGLIDVAPETIKHVIDTLAGGLGTDASYAVGAVSDAAKGNFDVDKTPFVRDVVRDLPDSTREYYVAKDRFDAGVYAVNHYKTAKERSAYYRENPFMKPSLAERIKNLNKTIKELREKESKTEAKDRKAVYETRRLRLQSTVLRLMETGAKK